ncbi:Actin, larval muscle,Actin, clone 403,Actin-104,Actin, alpha sarcomeric/skeletal,Actin-2, muscle-specific,Actin, cytoskeletal 3A,Beta-actin-like protein 2,Actin, indirect flight muscle,Actin-103,Actin-46,Putative actin-9,Actin-65,Actin, cytoskeletal 1A,Actin-42A,Actin-4,Actin-71,Actin-75,Actin-85C,Putative actin-22,Actin, alpha skeletal muscle 3,Putative actin-28,Actin, cytoskeletal 1B,Actin, muscle-type A2,Actin-8,Major actin,Actin, adductor muscle,Actin CyI, cytoplasmic,Actin, macronuclear,Actin, cytopla|uniref:ACTB_G1 n=1 Tax=Mytilus coruscus TaxID=42192 RepID=A0A6J8EV57_MYTCO|nr:Actin, larval muscle,Actin, clone 403,Actin-104,Actin, alpha sarcomeric/skeletal,Actin-2, muscle-specific,Actin, cytoskeletal 3A,Beta-actin-like protein 2,Actin, indirect flight muscle,Actin-103,Actin-46,Putative actin-9,Actin-65,Actin, cytoskeletal 1A,Actin-42A,Actin-4,Actin-71,Actin-75,Actin-85C,Putative actin-22,Actin, alpha skeletal muscle 3,Putative actin-28,Actin, cytoskeletal 1B,Actin, muscle-type A2,Actin-8,Major actin,Actin, adductor muscle,Actin CyI, cytoplasmic,Actin, macronuclear,Act
MATVVMDNGTWFCKAGFAGEDNPKTVFPAVGVATGMDPNSVYIGCEASRKQGLLTVRHPITDGFIWDWNYMENILHHTFHDELGIATKEHPILLTEAQINPKCLRERMTAMIFEDFDFPAMYIKAKEVLSLYSSGCITGVALDIGDGISCSIPAFEGYAIRHAVMKSGIFGRDLTDCLQQSLNNRGYSFSSVADKEIIRNIKENLCYVASDFKKEMEMFSTEVSSLEKKFELPDGKVVKIGSEQIRCVEPLFQPSIIGMDFYPGLHETLNDSIMKCGGDLHKDLYGNIVLCGETSRTPGIIERMQSEITKLAPLIKKIKVKTPPDIKNSAWVGGSILASLPTFQQMCITKEEYDEIGPTIVNKKCF